MEDGKDKHGSYHHAPKNRDSFRTASTSAEQRMRPHIPDGVFNKDFAEVLVRAHRPTQVMENYLHKL